MAYENKQDWPEKYDIQKLVTRDHDIDKIIDGDKTSVRRNDRYADAGDEVLLKGQTFVVKDVYPQKLKNVTEAHAKQEGYANLEAYKDALTSIHHAAVWEPEQVVWAHEFKKK